MLRRLFRPLFQVSYGDLATLGNAGCGLLAITYFLDGTRSAILIGMLLLVVGAFLDSIDGMLVRRYGSSHRFGPLLDSMADMVSFCLAPMALIYTLCHNLSRGPAFSLSGDWDVPNMLALTGALLVGLLGVLRLARFTYEREEQLRHFSGMPTPAMMVLVLIVCLRFSWLTGNTATWPPALLGLMAFSMVTTLPLLKARGQMLLPIFGAVLLLQLAILAAWQRYAVWELLWTVATLFTAIYIIGSPLWVLRNDPDWRSG
ncbi:MAG: CDP-alcohol phosphatidyltransferase family protein [Candidatus Thermoplasmatota archaeon]|nr:CDP-alcohol phosphatidyltransferase family protein [Candidatus Thermoplasmatota archaeon]